MWPSLGNLSSYMRDKIDIIKYQETDPNRYNWSWPVHELKKTHGIRVSLLHQNEPTPS